MDLLSGYSLVVYLQDPSKLASHFFHAGSLQPPPSSLPHTTETVEGCQHEEESRFGQPKKESEGG